MSGTTIGAALRTGAERLALVSESPQLDAQLLLAHVLDVDRAVLLTHPERALIAGQAARFADLVAVCADGLPVPYAIGARAFFRHDFTVTPDVLIPRPETEHLVEAALAWAESHDGPGPLTVVDVGTGSGAIAISLAAGLPDAFVHAVDISAAALAVARGNAARLGLDGVRFHSGDLLDALPPDIRPDLIAANLPYIPTDELDTLPVVKHEPRLALDGGADGLDFIRRLVRGAVERVPRRFCLLLEIGAEQGGAVVALCRSAFPEAAVRVINDYAGHDRVVEVIR